jgi:hypothetical protein
MPIHTIDADEEIFRVMNAVKVSAGRCEISIDGKPCSKPAAYKQILSGSRQFLFCEEHASRNIKRAAEEAEKRGARK